MMRISSQSTASTIADGEAPVSAEGGDDTQTPDAKKPKPARRGAMEYGEMTYVNIDRRIEGERARERRRRLTVVVSFLSAAIRSGIQKVLEKAEKALHINEVLARGIAEVYSKRCAQKHNRSHSSLLF